MALFSAYKLMELQLVLSYQRAFRGRVLIVANCFQSGSAILQHV